MHTHIYAHSCTAASTLRQGLHPGTWMAMGIKFPSAFKCSRQRGAHWCCFWPLSSTVGMPSRIL